MSDIEINSQVIGIDLGTTYSCVGVWRNGRVEIIANDQGNRITPSYVAFKDNEKVVGDLAKEHATIKHASTFFDSKRMIGRSISDQEIKGEIKTWPFEIQEDKGRLVYKLKQDSKCDFYTPEEISSEILIYMKKTAEHYLGCKVKDAVITVPAYFNNAQRQSTIDAGILAGLNVVSILNEPTAAAIAYGFENHKRDKRTVLVYDLGGGTFDVSLLNITGGSFEVLATSGNSHLGGNDFDVRLFEYFKEEFRKKSNVDISDSRSAIGRLRAKSEQVKKILSKKNIASIDMDFLYKENHFQTTITKEKFEELCNDLFSKTLECLNNVLSDSGIPKTKVDEIIMIGGSTRIPKIQEIVYNFFNGKTLYKNINPEEAVAHGATIFATKFSKRESNILKELLIVDVTPLNLGVEIVGDLMATVVPKNSELPVAKTLVFTTENDNQNEVILSVYEGASIYTISNHLLGEFTLTDIPPAKACTPLIDVTFSIDTNGILSVRAYDQKSKNSNSIQIKYKVNHRPKPKKTDIIKNSNTESGKKDQIALVKD